MPPKAVRKPVGSSRRTSRRYAKSAKPKTTFFDLPLEIRDIIYGSLLTEESPIEPLKHCAGLNDGMSCYIYPPRHHNPKHGLQPQLLRACSQLNQEGSRILYGKNTFTFDDTHMCCTHLYEELSMFELSMDEEGYGHSQEVHDLKLFLIDIGPCNRLLLRKLEFTFSSGSVFGRGFGTKGNVKPGRYPGKSFDDGFRILGKGHGLQSLKITLNGCHLPQIMQAKHDLLEAICTVKKVPDLKIETTCECHPDRSKSMINGIHRAISSTGTSRAYDHSTLPTMLNIWGNPQTMKSGFDEKKGKELAKNILNLIGERKALEARIADDIERRDYIDKMLEKASASVT